MRLVCLDAETFFSSTDYTLSKMSTEAYIRDPRFQAHGAAIKWGKDHPAHWYNERELRWVLQNEDWADTLLICHHTAFDGLILSHHYHVHPRMLGCTLSMARMMLGNHLSVSLEQVRRHFGMPSKITPYQQFDGKHWHEMSPAVQQQVAEGCCDETESIWKIFHLLMQQGFPKEELYVVDTTIKMFTEPVLRGDIPLLAQVWEKESVDKSARLAALGVDASDLQSNYRFAALLRAAAIEPERKPGKPNPDGSEKLIYAFAKTDQFMRDLLEHDDERVRTLAEARLGQKSTLLQTRAATLGWMARRGSMPVYLNYAGAHTTRWSGGDGCNWQNFKRGSDIRRAVMAPAGGVLAAIDLSQIECRILNYLAGQDDVIQKFRNNEDPYVGIASQFYGRAITKNDTNERGTGKQAELSCGYGCGGPKFKATARLGIYGPPVSLTDDESAAFVKLYRNTHRNVMAYWQQAESNLRRIANNETFEWGPMRVVSKRIYLPNNSPLIYDNLEWHEDHESGERYWRNKTRNGWSKLYGAKLVENVIQALARVVMSQAMVRITQMGYRIVTTTHDEIVVSLKQDGNEQHHVERCVAEMRRTPDWLPGIPLDAEWSIGERYSK